jgi:hypothetical protein
MRFWAFQAGQGLAIRGQISAFLIGKASRYPNEFVGRAKKNVMLSLPKHLYRKK